MTKPKTSSRRKSTREHIHKMASVNNPPAEESVASEKHYTPWICGGWTPAMAQHAVLAIGSTEYPS